MAVDKPEVEDCFHGDWRHSDHGGLPVGLSEAPTSSVFGGNQLKFTLYPIIVYYRDPAQGDVHGGDMKKAAIAFVSDDRQHGCEQIEDFDERSKRV